MTGADQAKGAIAKAATEREKSMSIDVKGDEKYKGEKP